MNFSDRVFFDPDKRIEHIEGLWWVRGDSGSWDGPHRDWIDHHRAEIVDRSANSEGVCVQAGGNLGAYPKLLARYFRTVYTFEPDPLNFYCLTRNLDEPNVYKINGAVGSKKQLVGLHRSSHDNLGTHRINEGEVGGAIPTFRVDDLGLNRLDLLWFDIEGYELDAIIGSLETIEKFRPLVALETVNEKIRSTLTELGYDTVGRSKSDTVFKFKG